MRPIEALTEIAFLLEAELAPVFRVRAFRRAAAATADLSDSELAARLADGRLAATKGFGPTSLAVTRQALDGAVPAYLADLRSHAAAPLSGAAGALLEAVRGDLHVHTDASDGTADIATMADAAHMLGREYIAITDHSPHLRVANGLSGARLEAQLADIADINEADGRIRVLTGIETDILEDGTLDQDPELLERLDVVVASVHSQLRAESDVLTPRLLAAVADPRTNVLGHLTGRLVSGPRAPRPRSTFDAEAVLAACAEHDVAVEINSRPEREDPPDDLLAAALEAGCLFAIDTDAHAPGHQALIRLGVERAASAGVPASRIVTTWTVDRLLEWTTSKR